MPDMSHLKPGDPVAILSGSHAAQTLHVKRATVKRVTKTQITLNESDYTYRLSDGKRRGHSSMWERTPTAYPTDHPVVLAALDAETCRARTRIDAYAEDQITQMLDDLASVLTSALPHLTADDLRATDAAEEIRTEGWMQGWAAGRDLDGDEDATPYLRDTPAGRALMAEGWREATLWIRYRDGRWPQDMEDANPYEETPDDRP